MMNTFRKILNEAYPTHVLNKEAGKLLAHKPTGFHPLKKCIYRRECREVLSSYQHLIERRTEGRILGNKGVSAWTKRRIKNLSEMVR